MEKLWQYREASEYILGIPKFTKKNTPKDTKSFWEFLGCPGGELKIIHVAGTNGKGSVCSYLNGILQEKGFTVGLFTSPHLVELTERIQINRRELPRKVFLESFSVVYEAVQRASQTEKLKGYHPTFFEFLFFVGMVSFQKSQVDYVILETGMGGRLDATNCIPKPLVTILTRISLDHTEYLGDTIEKIAGEKAGIFKEHVPVVALTEPVEAAEVIRQQAREKGCEIFWVSPPKPESISPNQKKYVDFSYPSVYYNNIRVTLSTAAIYQAENASLALRAAEVLFGDKLQVKELQDAMQKAVWEGRMEEVLPNVYVDGAHNEDGIRVFLDTVSRLRSGAQGGNCYLLFSVVKEKDYNAMMKRLAKSGLFDAIALAPLQTSRSFEGEQLLMLAGQNGLRGELFGDAESAFDALLNKKREEDMVFAAGSLYLAGQIKGYLQKKAQKEAQKQ